MSDLDKLEKKYEKGNKAQEIRDSISKLKETPSNPDTKRAFESRKETLDSVVRAAKQATAGFRSQWSGLDDEGKGAVTWEHVGCSEAGSSYLTIPRR